MRSFFTFINKFTILSEESRADLTSVLQPMELPKGHNLLRPGAICQYLYYIEKGLTRTYYLKNGKDVTDWPAAITITKMTIRRLAGTSSPYSSSHPLGKKARL